MQITLSVDQVDIARKVLELIVWPTALWIAKSAVRRLKNNLNTIITDNVNRIKDELCLYLDKKFSEHENHAFDRLNRLEKQVNQLIITTNDD